MSFLQGLFGPSKADIWQKFSAATGGQYVGGDFWKGDKVEVRHGPWIVTLDTFVVSTGKTTVTYTRMRAPYVNPGRFTFTIYRNGLFSDIGKWLGMQDVTIGYPEIDDGFIIKGNDEPKLRTLFSNAKIRDLIAAQPEIRFSVMDDDQKFFGAHFPDGVDELHFQVVGVIKDVDRLKLLYDLFSETLDQLCRMGAATEKSPGVGL